MGWTRHVARIAEGRGACMLMMGKPQRKRALGRPRCRYEDNINIHLKEISWEIVDRIDLAQDKGK